MRNTKHCLYAGKTKKQTANKSGWDHRTNLCNKHCLLRISFPLSRLQSACIFFKGKISRTRIFLFAAIKPSFAESGFGPFYLFKGTAGRLTCNPKAAPRPSKDQYKWYKGTTLLTSSPPYRIEHGEYSTLIIDNADKNRDQGLYKCYAENVLGNATENATATVFGENTMHVCLLNKRALDMARSQCPVLDCIADVL